MAVYRYPPEVHEFVKKWAPKLRDEDLAEACNRELGTHFTAAKMKSFRANHGYRNYKKQWTSEEYWKYQKRYPQGMYEFIRDNSWNVSSKDMAKMVKERFGVDFTQSGMKQFRQRHGIKSGVTGWFQKGNPPGTKGKTLEEICGYNPEKIARVKATWFKKTHSPSNLLPVGSVTVNKDGYLIRKKAMEGVQWERWEFLHRAVWEEHNGPIPDGMAIIFKDGDRQNCDISNLMMVTKRENAALNKYRSEHPEITEMAAALVKLKLAAADKRKQGGDNGKQKRLG